MKSESWEQVKQIYDSALKVEVSQRAAYLDHACGGDAALRREVESLLAYEIQAESFIEAPALAVAACLLAQGRAHSPVGQSIGPYQVLSLLGAGGMGEVYLAEDSRLGRKVALKMLPARYTQDGGRLRRFAREARAASALNHPNIITIHEIGEASTESGTTQYIVTEYVEGETLRQRMVSAPLGRIKASEAIEIVLQIAAALSAAHEAGIMHRDIKPENVMVRRDGIVKVLDFGLSKLTEPNPAGDSQAATITKNSTDPGVVMGTPRYMSPEQARGEKADARTDIFSLGVMLYEMIVGRAPFAGSTLNEVIAAILRDTPPPVAECAPDAPPELERILSRALRKDRDERYPTIKELLLDLKGLTEQRGFEARLVGEIKRHKVGVVIAILTLASIAFYSLSGRSKPTSREIHSIAVLPFVSATVEPNEEYLSDGITESLINSLSQLSQLKVIARTTAFLYKGTEKDAHTIGHDLRVDAVITGRITKQSDTLIVQADLLSASDGSEVWGARYSRKLSDYFVVQEQIAQEIAENLQFKLTGEEKQALAKRYTANIKAYQNYLLGWTYLQRRTRPDFFTAISYLESAIGEQPNYALAYAALTDVYVSLTIRGFIGPDEGRRKAEEAARTALSLDPNLAQAHAAIGETRIHFAPFDFSTGDRELRHAIELSPSLAMAHFLLGNSLLEQGRLDEALREYLMARDLDPLSPITARLQAYGYLLERDYPGSLERFRQSYDLGPAFIIWPEVEAYIQNGNLSEAVARLEEEKKQRKDDPLIICSEGMLDAAQGKRAEALRIVERLQQMPVPALSQASWLARIYATMNEKEAALEWLERGLAAGGIVNFFKDAPVWDTIRDDRRFQEFLSRIGVQQ